MVGLGRRTGCGTLSARLDADMGTLCAFVRQQSFLQIRYAPYVGYWDNWGFAYGS